LDERSTSTAETPVTLKATMADPTAVDGAMRQALDYAQRAASRASSAAP
jgi:hypothetical protein